MPSEYLFQFMTEAPSCSRPNYPQLIKGDFSSRRGFKEKKINLAVAQGQEEESQTIIQLVETSSPLFGFFFIWPCLRVVYIKYKSINVTGRSLLSDDRQSHIDRWRASH
jgi:hypothetical protein